MYIARVQIQIQIKCGRIKMHSRNRPLVVIEGNQADRLRRYIRVQQLYLVFVGIDQSCAWRRKVSDTWFQTT